MWHEEGLYNTDHPTFSFSSMSKSNWFVLQRYEITWQMPSADIIFPSIQWLSLGSHDSCYVIHICSSFSHFHLIDKDATRKMTSNLPLCLLHKLEVEGPPMIVNKGMQEWQEWQMQRFRHKFRRKLPIKLYPIPSSSYLLADSVIIHCFSSSCIDLGGGGYCFLHLRNRFWIGWLDSMSDHDSSCKCVSQYDPYLFRGYSPWQWQDSDINFL